MNTQKSESPKHKSLVEDLLNWFVNTKGYRITAADFNNYDKPSIVSNSGKIGDEEDKIPDIETKDESNNIYIRGEAKTGEGDLEILHTETQFKLFSNLHNSENKKDSLLYIIVPASKFGELITLLQDLGLSDKSNVIPVKSGTIN